MITCIFICMFYLLFATEMVATTAAAAGAAVVISFSIYVLTRPHVN